MTMMKAVNSIRIKKGKVAEVLALFEKPKKVHTFDGFVFMEVLEKENTEGYDELQICTTWEDESYFQAWRESRAAGKAHGAKKGSKSEGKESPILSSELSTFKVPIQHYPA